MIALKMLGDWLEDSGWTDALVEAKIASVGVANYSSKPLMLSAQGVLIKCVVCVAQKSICRERRRIGIGRYSILRQMVRRKNVKFTAPHKIRRNYLNSSTLGQQVLCNPPRDDTSSLAPGNYEEANTRMMVYVADAVQRRLTKVLSRTVNTDVVVILIAVYFGVVDSFWRGKKPEIPTCS